MHTWLFRLLLLGLLLPWLAGCGRQDAFESMLSDYVARLARSLDQSPPSIQPASPVRLPDSRQLQLISPATQINLLEFLELSQCSLHTVIAETNSSLGKFAVASQALLQELKFLRHVDSCIEALAPASELRQVLVDTRAEKQAALPIYLWRATLGGEEFREFWKVRETTSGYPDNADSRTDLALNFLLDATDRILGGDYELDGEQLHQALGTLRNNEGGALVSTWQHTASALQAGNQVIEARRADRPLCYNDMVTPAAKVFRTVLVGYFVQQVQPKLAILSRRYYDLIPKVQALESRLSGIEPTEYRAWRTRRDELLAASLASVPLHIQQASPLMVECGFLPGT